MTKIKLGNCPDCGVKAGMITMKSGTKHHIMFVNGKPICTKCGQNVRELQ